MSPRLRNTSCHGTRGAVVVRMAQKLTLRASTCRKTSDSESLILEIHGGKSGKGFELSCNFKEFQTISRFWLYKYLQANPSTLPKWIHQPILIAALISSLLGLQSPQYWGFNSKLILHSGSFIWNLKIGPWKRRFLLETVIFRFYVELWRSTSVYNSHFSGGVSLRVASAPLLFPPRFLNDKPLRSL